MMNAATSLQSYKALQLQLLPHRRRVGGVVPANLGESHCFNSRFHATDILSAPLALSLLALLVLLFSMGCSFARSVKNAFLASPSPAPPPPPSPPPSPSPSLQNRERAQYRVLAAPHSGPRLVRYHPYTRIRRMQPARRLESPFAPHVCVLDQKPPGGLAEAGPDHRPQPEMAGVPEE